MAHVAGLARGDNDINSRIDEPEIISRPLICGIFRLPFRTLARYWSYVSRVSQWFRTLKRGKSSTICTLRTYRGIFSSRYERSKHIAELYTSCAQIIIMTNQVWLRVPRELADELNKIAMKKGITARGRWAVYARMVLVSHVEGSA